jgi:hypothetical protein
MENAQKVAEELSITKLSETQLAQTASWSYPKLMLKKLKGGFFLVVGYLLSPLCWWNDLFFNLPIAYFFGHICSWLSPNLFLPGSIAGYWLSNIIGILLMQVGVVDVFEGQSKERNLKKELFTGLASSTIYTILIVLLIQLKILDTPVPLFGG